MAESQRISGSFRDPSGFLFSRDSEIFRQVNQDYKPHFDRLMNSGLYSMLVGAEKLIPHEEAAVPPLEASISYKVIKPSPVPFISYPHEWSFSQLKDAALLTLSIAEKSLEHGMILKDASAYNIQFIGSKAVHIDTLSFDEYQEGAPWIAYRQFCQHFLAPLALMAKRDISLGKLSQIFIDGVPLGIASKLLPFSTRFSLQLLLHIHLHAKSQSHFSKNSSKGSKISKSKSVSKTALLGILDGLRSAVNSLTWKAEGTEWGDYYTDTNYSKHSMEKKAELVSSYLKTLSPRVVWDLGANTGRFSELSASLGAYTVAFDIDPAAIEKAYLANKKEGKRNVLPLILDLSNPSTNFGWAGDERKSLASRGPANTILALALVHHLAISNNVPLERIASFLASIGSSLIIEFVPKSDSQVQRLLSSREDIFSSYSKSGFESAFLNHFAIERSVQIEGSERWLYLMRRK